MTDTLEQRAQQIADRGREALLDRLRPTFRDAAQRHVGVLRLNDEQLEQMVQHAADRADGLQWRRALASIASEQLGIGQAEALSHPAVERAHAIIGAPSYEESVKALAERRQAAHAEAEMERAAQGQREAQAQSNGHPHDEPARAGTAEQPALDTKDEEDGEAEYLDEEEDDELLDEAEPPLRPVTAAAAEPAPGPMTAAAAERAPEPAPDPAPVAADARNGNGDAGLENVRLAVVHLGGVANLVPGEGEIELRLSDEGLDIIRGMDEMLGRLTWPDIRDLSVPPARGLRLRRRDLRAHLVVRTDNGDASFEVPAVAPDELREHLAPLVERHCQAATAG